MERKKHRNIALEIVVIMASVLGLMLLLYFVKFSAVSVKPFSSVLVLYAFKIANLKQSSKYPYLVVYNSQIQYFSYV